MQISILGASSGLGAAVTALALSAGHSVTAISRSPDVLRKRFGENARLTTRTADPTDSVALIRCYAGSDVVVFALNAAYEDWDPFMVQSLAATLAAISTLGPKPRLVFPGNVYALGRPIGPTFDETAQNRPISRKGLVRATMEKMLRTSADNGVQVLITRFADFFGPSVRNGLVDRIFGNALHRKPIELLGRATAPHQFTYVPDAAEAILMLLQEPQKDPIRVLNIPTHTVASMTEFSTDVARSAGVAEPKLRRMPWLMIRILGLFVPAMREVFEMRYLFEQSIILDGKKLAHDLPRFAATPMRDAISATLDSYQTIS